MGSFHFLPLVKLMKRRIRTAGSGENKFLNVLFGTVFRQLGLKKEPADEFEQELEISRSISEDHRAIIKINALKGWIRPRNEQVPLSETNRGFSKRRRKKLLKIGEGITENKLPSHA